MRQIHLSNGSIAIVDSDDYEQLMRYRWHADKDGYARRMTVIDGKTITLRMHRIINSTPLGFLTDHINGNILDNRRNNLRSVTVRQNAVNRPIPKSNKSGYKGVDYHRGKWRASIRINGRSKCLGHFTDIKEAAKAYTDTAQTIFGEYVRL